MPICNRFHEKLANNGRKTTFTGVQLFDALVRRFHEPRKSRLGQLKSTFNAENFIRRCLRQLILAQFALEMRLAARDCQKIDKNTHFSVQGHPRSLNSVAIEN